MYVNECARCGQSTLSALHIVDCPPSFEERHGRPKPPRIAVSPKNDYDARHGVISIWKDVHDLEPYPWIVKCPGRAIWSCVTHAEAIAWAMKEVNPSGVAEPPTPSGVEPAS